VDVRETVRLAVAEAVRPGLGVRTLTTDDWPAYFDLTRRAADFAETYDGGLPTADAVRADMTDAPPGAAADAKVLVGVFEDEREPGEGRAHGVLIAYLDLLVAYPDADTWYLGFLLIAQSERGRGLGRAILGGVERAAAGAGMKRLMLGVYDANTPGRAFWARLGFHDDKTYPDYTNPAGQPQPVTRMVKDIGTLPAK